MDTTGTSDHLSSNSPAAAASRWTHAASRRFQHLLDKSTPFVLHRWLAFAAVAIVYAVRVYFVEGFYIVSYALGIYVLNLLIAFLSPQVDPEFHDLSDDPSLPTRGSDEFRPFVRRLPEFKFCLVVWKRISVLLYKKGEGMGMGKGKGKGKGKGLPGFDSRYSMTKAFCIAFVVTFFRIFDVPVFWPILLFYWVLLFTLTMKKQIMHMVKHRYVPFSFGKRRYDVRAAASTESACLLPRD
ncbi:hypothetical protein RHMOL_Rhmol08G0113900 [Rhododendron molle]|uniref:Uncharacterized protein n=1 Tax=Rhododendron molle TaxID=49168 RepID=A0ACC0MMJ8_RHOML|nr:hypothetical protein RHMOL_Rhmol08G0113900 [Rhododendron molle]